MTRDSERTFGHTIDPPPASLTAGAVMSRFIDGLAFRYYWATEGLRPEDHAYRPAEDSMSMEELMRHIEDLVLMIRQAVRNEDYRVEPRVSDAGSTRAETLLMLQEIRDELRALPADVLATHRVLKRDGRDWPIWNIMNGPIADALTHVGQIVSWRRINGNPMPSVNVFLGKPPR